MSGLSNFFRRRDASAPVEVRPVGPGEIEPALRLILGSYGGRADSATAADFEGFAQQRGIDLAAIRVAVSGGKIAAACLPVRSPGHTALLMTSTAGSSNVVARNLAQCIASSAEELMSPAGGGIRIVQVLLEQSEAKLDRELRTCGFEEVATLIYLQRTLSSPTPAPALPPGLSLLQYSPNTHHLFGHAILASYQDSLDCPALHNRRGIDDVIAGHLATGEHDPDLWFCLMENGSPCGVLLLAGVPGHDALELVYLGLAPSARGRRVADVLLRLALFEIGNRGFTQLTLAVDAKNIPAIRLYHRHGLGEVHRRTALMKLAPATPTT